mmetsp:Transcript_27221/g.56200  ORF Transcript_27221/g.56200 Transcript_27221/m.56200 type:complete len:961 (+) Transcript_27221:286-3168(+)
MTASTSRQSTGRRRRGAYVYLDRLRNSLDSSPIINRTDAMESGHRNGSPQSRLGNRNIGYLFHTTFVMLTIFAFAGAMHHAAFVTRLSGGQGLSRVSLTNYPINCCWEMKSKASRNIPSKNFFGSLLMSSRSSASDTEVERDEKSGFDDEDEWRTILAAFQMYKAAYGDLKVPSRFVVPAMAPWPEPAWRLKLGQRVAAIRSTGKYVQNNEGRRKVLDDMGFLWRLRAPSPDKKLDGVAFDQVYDALKTYREVLQPKGKLDVPSTYVVPDCEPWPVSTRGLPLGKILPTVRSKAYLKSHPDAEAKLNSLGFGPDSKAAANDVRYQRVYDALVKYKELYGDLLVPQPFTVPEDSDEWPEEVRGLRLGARVNAIRSQGTFVKTDPSRKEELDALGFVWEPPANADGKRRGRKKKSETDEGYEDDESNNGDDDDDDDDSYSESPFASIGAAATSTTPSFDGRDPFFTGDQNSPPQWAFEGEDDAEMTNQEKDETVYATKKSFNETLEEMAEVAQSVGIMEGWTKNKRVIKGKNQKFVPWRNDDFGGDFVFDDVVEALKLYKELHGNFDDIEEDGFVVPEPVGESLSFSPFELAAMDDDGPEELNDIDGPWSESEDEDEMESKFSVVASSDWPEHLAGMKLGQIVSRIREGGLEVKHLPERKARLDEIGFDWGDPKRFVDVPFEKAMCALYAYFMVRGDTFVKADFVMPNEQPWPKALAGYELGKEVQRLRELQNFLEAYHPVKMSLLRMVDFAFFPELALPLDPNADDVNMEHLYVETFGHPLYHLSTVPLGLPERMMADGPNGPPEKLSSWYNYEYVREYYERPGALTDVADWMRDIGFHQLAHEHEQEYGKSHYRQLFLLREQLERKEITQEVWDREIDRIKDEVMSEFENWKGGYTGHQVISDGEYDYSTDEETYYYQTLEIGSNSGSQYSSVVNQPMMRSQSRDVIEEQVAEISFGDDE